MDPPAPPLDKPLRVLLPGAKLPGLVLDDAAPSPDKPKPKHDLVLPGFRPAPGAAKSAKKWHRPAKLIQDAPELPRSCGPSYDADSEDEEFVASLQSRNNAPTLEDLEKVIAVLETEDFKTRAALKESRDAADLRSRNAKTVAMAQYLLRELQRDPQNPSNSLVINVHKAGASAPAFSAPSAAKSPPSSKSVSPVRVHQVLNKTKRDANELFTYWSEKRKRTGSALLTVRTLEDPSTQVTADDLQRIQELREDLERARLIADSARKREKLKGRLAVLTCGGSTQN